MKVYPAAGLTSFAASEVPIYYIDPEPNVNEALAQSEKLKVITESAAIGLPKLLSQLAQDL